MTTTLLVALETHFARGADGCVRSTTGVDGYVFWQRYLDVFDEVLVAARTGNETNGSGCAQARGLHDRVEGRGVRVVALPDYRGPWAYLGARRPLIRTLRAAIAQADALCLRAPGAIAGLAWKLGGGRPFGVEVVGDPTETLAPGAVRSAVRPLARAVLARELRAMCAGATAVAYVAETFAHRYPPGGWSTAYSSIDLHYDAFATEADLARRADDVARRIAGTHARPWRLAFVGTLEELYKGPHVLIDAVARCRARGLDVELTMIGGGRHLTALMARAARLGIAAAVHFPGQVPAGAPVRELVDRADLFVLPSLGEGLPRAMIEAMARGVPGLGSRVSGIPELLPSDRLVPVGDVAALADAIERLCSPATDLVALGRRDRDIARRYQASEIGPRRAAFYRRLRDAATRASQS